MGGASALADVQILLYNLRYCIGILGQVLADLIGILGEILAYFSGILGEILLNLSGIFGQVVFDILEIVHDFWGAVFKLPFNIIGGSLEFLHPLAECPGKLGNLFGSKQ